MKLMLLCAVVATIVALPACVTNPIVGHAAVTSGRYQGDVGVTGNGATVTIQAGSDVPKLSIVGDVCKVTVESGARIGRIEFWETGSEVSIPADLDPVIAAVGANKVIRRTAGQ